MLTNEASPSPVIRHDTDKAPGSALDHDFPYTVAPGSLMLNHIILNEPSHTVFNCIDVPAQIFCDLCLSIVRVIEQYINKSLFFFTYSNLFGVIF